jgi:hypothetical protein
MAWPDYGCLPAYDGKFRQLRLPLGRFSDIVERDGLRKIAASAPGEERRNEKNW